MQVEFGPMTICALALISQLPLIVYGLVMLRAFLRVCEQNADYLRANLALSEKPAAVRMAAQMESDDVVEAAQANGAAQQPFMRQRARPMP